MSDESIGWLDRKGDEEHDSQVFDCPKCGTHLQFGLRIGIRRVKVAETGPEGWSKPIDNLSVPERAILDECRQSGLLDGYMVAFNASKLAGKPSDPEKFFLRFLAHAVRKKTPQFAIRLCLPKEQQYGTLELWTHGIVSAVIADGEFRQWLPTELVRGDKTSNLTLNGGWIQTGEKIDLNQWVRTKFGYVQGRGIMFQELRRRCVGEFDNL